MIEKAISMQESKWWLHRTQKNDQNFKFKNFLQAKSRFKSSTIPRIAKNLPTSYSKILNKKNSPNCILIVLKEFICSRRNNSFLLLHCHFGIFFIKLNQIIILRVSLLPSLYCMTLLFSAYCGLETFSNKNTILSMIQ